VLDEVGQARLAGGFVERADRVVEIADNDRSMATGQDQGF
jgi:hypothetical protein